MKNDMEWNKETWNYDVCMVNILYKIHLVFQIEKGKIHNQWSRNTGSMKAGGLTVNIP